MLAAAQTSASPSATQSGEQSKPAATDASKPSPAATTTNSTSAPDAAATTGALPSTGAGDSASTAPTNAAASTSSTVAPAAASSGASPSSTSFAIEKNKEKQKAKREIVNPNDLVGILPTPELPKGKLTLIGGRVTKVDPIRDRVTVRPYGGKPMKIYFDQRSRVTRNGKDALPSDIKVGDRVYLDTELDGSNVFAKNVRVQTEPIQADAHGQLVAFNQRTGDVLVRDDLSGQDVRFKVQPGAAVDLQGRPGTLADLQPGSVITAHFLPGQNGRNLVNQVTILAAPGADYIFEGKVTNVDIRNRSMAIENNTDGKIYDIRFDPARTPIGDVRVGSQVNISARFDGRGYSAETVSPTENTGGMSIEDQDASDKAAAKAERDAKKHHKAKDRDDDTDNGSPKSKDKDEDPDAENPQL